MHNVNNNEITERAVQVVNAIIYIIFCLNSDIPANLTVHTETKLVAGSIFKATCKVTRGTLNFTDIEWTNNRGVIISNEIFYTETSPILSVNLTLGPLNTSNAGTYTCETHVEDYVAQLIGIKQVDIFVKGQHCTIVNLVAMCVSVLSLQFLHSWCLCLLHRPLLL